MFRRKSEWPVVQLEDADLVDQLIDTFFETETVGDVQPVVEALMEISAAQPWEGSRSIWSWFAAWCEQARGLGTPLTAAKILMFTTDWHEAFVPQSGTAWMSLGKATGDELDRIRRSALAAFQDLSPSTIVRMTDGVSVADITRDLRANHAGHQPTPPPPVQTERSRDAGWLASGEERYRDMVSRHFGSPESIAAGGHKRLAAGDAAAALFFFQKAIDLLHTLYVVSGMQSRVPSLADLDIIDWYLNTTDEILGLYPRAPIGGSVREVTHRLRTISTRCKETGIDPSLYLDALGQLGNLAPEVDVHDILWRSPR